jgi:hypothetical protein
MKIFTTLFALVGLIFLTSIVDIASASGRGCGRCDWQVDGAGLALWIPTDSNAKDVFACNKLSDEQRLGTCENYLCDFCVVWK